MKQIVLMVAAMLVAGTLVVGLGFKTSSVAQAQEEPRDETSARGAPFTLTGAEAEGVEMVPGESEVPQTQQDTEPPPLILSEEAEAAKERAERGEAPPTGKQIVEAPDAEAAGDSLAPTLGKTFRAISGDSTESFPPDHQIAAGPNNVLVATNTGYRIFDKDGRQRESGTLVDFFSPLGAEHNDVFDPWLVYDPYIKRFWFLAASGRTTAHSDMVIGVSRTSDATLGWRLWEIDATLNGGTDTQNWCDYPKLGFDRQAVYVTCNMFQLNTDVTPNRNEFQYSKIRVLTKGQFLVNSNPGFVGWDFWDLDEGDNGEGARAFTIQPAQMFGASTADGEFLIGLTQLETAGRVARPDTS